MTSTSMKFNKKITHNEMIFIINEGVVDDNICTSIVSEILPRKKTGIDMRHVYKIEGNDFIKYLLQNKYKLFNLRNEVLTYLAIVLKDGLLKSFMNIDDFCENKRELIKRKFLVV